MHRTWGVIFQWLNFLTSFSSDPTFDVQQKEEKRRKKKETILLSPCDLFSLNYVTEGRFSCDLDTFYFLFQWSLSDFWQLAAVKMTTRTSDTWRHWTYKTRRHLHWPIYFAFFRFSVHMWWERKIKWMSHQIFLPSSSPFLLLLMNQWNDNQLARVWWRNCQTRVEWKVKLMHIWNKLPGPERQKRQWRWQWLWWWQ